MNRFWMKQEQQLNREHDLMKLDEFDGYLRLMAFRIWYEVCVLFSLLEKNAQQTTFLGNEIGDMKEFRLNRN